MNEVTIEFPASQVRTGRSGFLALGKLHNLMSEHRDSDLRIDCSSLSWFDADLGSALMTLVNLSRQQGNQVSMLDLRPKVKLILQKK